MNKLSRVVGVAAVFTAPLVAGSACTQDRDAFRDDPVQFDAGGEPGEAPKCGFRCSRDLKRVLKGCEGAPEEIVATCGPDQGCGVETCVDACASAALSKGSVGCSFWTLPPDDIQYGAGSCLAAMVANTWDRPVRITVEYDGKPLDISKSVFTATRAGTADPIYTALDGALAPGEVGIVFLAQSETLTDPEAPRCPEGTKAALPADPISHGTSKTRAFHIATDSPVAAYSMFPYGGAESFVPTATLLLPVSSWDTSYLAISPAKFGKISASSLDRRTLQIVADEDDTVVSMRPTVDIGEGRDVAPGVTGEVVSWTLSRGQVLQITQGASTSGSPISANKPVGMFGGSPCSFLPSETPYCDLTQEQIAPFAQWGTSYALVPYLARTQAVTGQPRETVPWSLVGSVDGTVLTYDPAKPPGAPSTLSAGEVAAFMTDAIVSVKSQDDAHPFHAAVYMTGSTFGGGSPGGGRTLGDPEFVNIVPSDQFLDRYVFFVDYTYPESSLTVVRRKTAGGFRPVELDCAGPLEGFVPLGASGEYEYAWVRLTTGYLAEKFARGECGHGRHEIESDGPFSVTVWGIGRDASYGYAGGTGARKINGVPPPPVR
ncbi:MAG: IgGFc-binding protein [Labilithrix sp.]|nr:IgGFc-binding protein [Labilithrix sp.]